MEINVIIVSGSKLIVVIKTIGTGQETLVVSISMQDTGSTSTWMVNDSTTFMEEVETYMTYVVASFIDMYWFPVLIPIGLVGNTLSFLVMIKPNNRKMSTCIYMAAMSINDNLMMCSAFHYWLINAVNIHKWHVKECQVSCYLHNFCLQCATYQVLSMMSDKYVTIKWPHRATTYSTPRRARLIVFGVFIFTLSYNVPHLFGGGLLGGQCLAYVVGGTITRIFSWISFIVNGIIPFSMLIYINNVIVQNVRKSRTLFRGTTTFSKEHDIHGNQGTDTRQRTMKSAENQLTIMLLLVTLLFSILLIPTYIRFIYLTFVKNDTPIKYAKSMLIFQKTFKLYVTNSGVNFFLYCISGRKFRNDLKETLSCGNVSSHSISERRTTQWKITIVSKSVT